ncbi:hypothetical protein [Streptomyces sp. NBC_00887]|uniref:hypothetical protein n=1 Tax=Streptomyces sp. NBC_00887 TaxID=2975859 RepID=UPI00386AD19B|nr:hypothetical protein OG844_30075 [Streptomyces sp. NBC_00887]
MSAEAREHTGRRYAVQFHYALPDDAWAVELSEAVPAPAARAENPDADRHLPGAAFLVAFVPDEDPNAEPAVHIHSHDGHVVPYAITRWFMEQVADHVDRCGTAIPSWHDGGTRTPSTRTP